MSMRGLAACCALAGLITAAAAASGADPAPGLTAALIVEKNAAARGGLEAWRKIQTMSWTDAGPHHALPGFRNGSPTGSDSPRAMESK